MLWEKRAWLASSFFYCVWASDHASLSSVHGANLGSSWKGTQGKTSVGAGESPPSLAAGHLALVSSPGRGLKLIFLLEYIRGSMEAPHGIYASITPEMGKIFFPSNVLPQPLGLGNPLLLLRSQPALKRLLGRLTLSPLWPHLAHRIITQVHFVPTISIPYTIIQSQSLAFRIFQSRVQ